MKITVATLCSGYDSQCLALERLKRDYQEFDYELKWWSEIDPHAIKAHNALFPQWEDRNIGDMTKVDWSTLEKVDLLFYSTPCQSISNAGLQHGFTEGSGTRSSIIWFVRDAVDILRPKFAVLENVRAMVSAKFIDMFNLWQSTLEKFGYRNYAQVLNARYFGVPQNRDRIFLVSTRDDIIYHFPKNFELKKKMTDLLETDVEEKFFVKEETAKAILDSTYSERRKRIMFDKHICRTLEARDGKEPKMIVLGWTRSKTGGTERHAVEVANCVTAKKRDNTQNYIIEDDYRIRRLTPRECFRLMGVEDSDIDKIDASGISKTQKYKMAGNSIVVDVLYHLFRKMFIDTESESKQLTLF